MYNDFKVDFSKRDNLHVTLNLKCPENPKDHEGPGFELPLSVKVDDFIRCLNFLRQTYPGFEPNELMYNERRERRGYKYEFFLERKNI